MNRCSLVFVTVTLLAFATAGAIAQQPALEAKGKSKPAVTTATPVAHPQKPKPASMTNQDVIDLVKAGFSEDLVAARIKQAKDKAFDLAPKAMVGLKTSGVSERLIAVMLGVPDPGSSVSQPTSAPVPTAVVPTGQQIAVSYAPPSTKSFEGREAGIYLAEGDKFIPLEPTVFSGVKTGGMFTSMVTAGIKKMNLKAVVRSPRSIQRVQITNPVFYFYFENRSSGLSNTGMMTGIMLGASSPNEFILARMTQKRNERELITDEAGAFRASSGTRSQDTVDILIERLQPGVYKVTPRNSLTPGEYCFFYAAGASTMMAAGSGKLFDFGVDPGAEASR